MNPETIKALTELVQALHGLAAAMGAWPLAVTAIGSVWGLVFYSMWRDKRRANHALLVVDHKEKEIERLAEDNRRYREVYLIKMGVPADVLQQDRQDSVQATEDRRALGGGKRKR